MRKLLLFTSTVAVTAAAALAQGSAAPDSLPPAAKIKIDFIRDVEPILSQKCHSCHGPQVQQSGLRLDRRQSAMRGGDYGPVIIAGKSAESKLIKRVASGGGGAMQMPPTGALTSEEIGILRAWIDQGADFRIEVKEEPAPKPVDPKVESFISAIRADRQAEVAKVLDETPEMAKTAVDNGGSTPLHHAAGFGSVGVMRLLIEHGADVNARNRRKSTPLHWAIHDAAKVRLLLERGAAVDVEQADGRTPLFQAASLGDGVGIMQLLIAKGADVNAAASNGQVPLMAAARGGRTEAIRLLLDHKANVNARNGAGATALMAAASVGNPSAVRLLLENGADPNLRTKRNETALADAATSGDEETVRLLLAKGAEVNVRDARGYTALMYAAGSDAMPLGVVKMLLAKGADASIEGEGETAKSLAAKRGDTAVARLLGVGAAPPAAARADERGNRHTFTIAESVEKAMDPLASQSHNFIRIGGCNSCHAQDLVSAAAAVARDRGLAAPKSIAQLPDSMRTSPERVMDLGVIGAGSVAWELFDSGMNRVPADQYIEASVRYLKAMQTPDGNWTAPQSRRPPMSAGEPQTAALAIYALQQYAPRQSADSVSRAASWLQRAKAANTQDRAFQLLGLYWAGVTETDTIVPLMKALTAAQHADGGWSQLPNMGSDAYATGQALYALATAGKMAPGDAVYQKGCSTCCGASPPTEPGGWRPDRSGSNRISKAGSPTVTTNGYRSPEPPGHRWLCHSGMKGRRSAASSQ